MLLRLHYSGNRAANGVVIITTKSGRNTHKPSITLQMNQGMYNRGIPEYDRLDADRWMEATWMAKKNAMMSNAGHVGKRCCRICHGTRG